MQKLINIIAPDFSLSQMPQLNDKLRDLRNCYDQDLQQRRQVFYQELEQARGSIDNTVQALLDIHPQGVVPIREAQERFTRTCGQLQAKAQASASLTALDALAYDLSEKLKEATHEAKHLAEIPPVAPTTPATTTTDDTLYKATHPKSQNCTYKCLSQILRNQDEVEKYISALRCELMQDLQRTEQVTVG